MEEGADVMLAEDQVEEFLEEEEWVEYEPLTEEEIAERNDSDNDVDDDDEEEDRHPRKVVGDGEEAGESSKTRNDNITLVQAPARVIVPDGQFVAPPHFAAVENTAAVMRIAAAGTGSHEGKEVVVLYRYTRYSKTWSGRRGVEVCRRTKLHWLRFAVPHAGVTGRALAWVGSALGPLIYPALFRKQLGELWSVLLAAAPAINGDAVPLQVRRLQVVVDAGILRRDDVTAERMHHLRGALEDTAVGEAWPQEYHVGFDLELPEPVRREEDGDRDDGSRSAKRRRVLLIAEEDECSMCCEPMESDMAAWPGCGHVLHGQCMEKTLAERVTCPLCRRHLDRV